MSLTYICTFIPFFSLVGFGSAERSSSDSVSMSCCEPSGASWVCGAYHPGGHPAREAASAGPGAPAGKPLARCLGSAASCRLARRVGCGWCTLTGVVPLPSRGRGGNESSVASHLMGQGITARLCNWWCCSHLCAKPSKHTVGGWQGCVGCSRLGLKFKLTVQ